MENLNSFITKRSVFFFMAINVRTKPILLEVSEKFVHMLDKVNITKKITDRLINRERALYKHFHLFIIYSSFQQP